MVYKVVEFFTDLQDNDYAYSTGDTFPRAGVEVSKDRIAELASTENKRGIVLIKAVEDPVAETGKKPKKATKKKEK